MLNMKISDMMDHIQDDTVPVRVLEDVDTRRILDMTMDQIHTRPVRRRRRSFGSLAAACLTVFLLALPVSAEIYNGYISNLLAPLYGMAQSEIVDSIGVPLGASTTVGDYTLTADAVIGDRYNLAIVYSLTRTDGGDVDPWLRFDGTGDTWGFGSGGGSLSYKPSSDGKTLHIIQDWTSQHPPRLFLKRKASMVFTDLERWDPDRGQGTPVAQGEWALNFTIRYEDSTIKLPVRGRTVTDAGGREYQLKKVLLSPIGLHIDMEAPNPFYGGVIDNGPLFPDFRVSALLEDGTVVEFEDHNAGGSASDDRRTMDGDWGTMFKVPIPIEDIRALNICGTLIEVE